MNYIAPNKSLHFIEPEFAHLLPAGCLEISEAEAEALRPKPDHKAQRRAEINAALAKIDADSARPARAVAVALAAGQAAPAFDLNKLKTMEASAATLRAEFAQLA